MPTISDAIRWSRTPDGAVLMDIQRGQMFCVNALGSEVLELLDKGWNETQIADQVSTAFGADVVSVRADVRDFLEVLRRHKILPAQDAAGTHST